jgi:hypothetical protein
MLHLSPSRLLVFQALTSKMQHEQLVHVADDVALHFWAADLVKNSVLVKNIT